MQKDVNNEVSSEVSMMDGCRIQVDSLCVAKSGSYKDFRKKITINYESNNSTLQSKYFRETRFPCFCLDRKARDER